ncbi:conserved hypothetical protein [Clostridium botulinum C str. Eklund]|nr:conserved hypothetical protein [Clostridium botulinum C str. Eklund]NEZ48828.1 carboxypeptidase regulatory-like domain-containing protein [Clostridium botulinum]
MALTQYQYVLGQSATKQITNPGQEGDINLSLSLNSNNITGGNITGTVINASGTPIEDAYVKLMSTNYQPIMHTMSNASGQYVPAGSYTIFCIAPEMAINEGQPITVQSYGSYTSNFTLQADPNEKNSLVVGDLTDSSTEVPIGNASVFLYSTNGTLVASTYSNKYGQYAFSDIPNGNYNVVITAPNYKTLTVPTTVTNMDSIVQVNEALTASTSSPSPSPALGSGTGTISGVITDLSNNNVAISGANVILYSVGSNGQKTPIVS